MNISFTNHIRPFNFQSTIFSKSKLLPICAAISFIAAVCFLAYQLFQIHKKNLKEKQIKKQNNLQVETKPAVKSEPIPERRPEIKTSLARPTPINKSEDESQSAKKDDPKKDPITPKLPDLSTLSNTFPFPNKSSLPECIEDNIFSFLGLEDVKQCPVVGKAWLASFKKDKLWKNLAQQLQIPLKPKISIKKQIFRKCYYDFGIYDPKLHQIIGTRELTVKDAKECQRIVKTFPNTYLILHWGMGKSHIYYNFKGKYGAMDSDSVLYDINEAKKLMSQIKTDCKRIFLSEAKFKQKCNLLQFGV